MGPVEVCMALAKARWHVMLMVTVGESPARTDVVLDYMTDNVSDVPVGTLRILVNGLKNFGDARATITRIEGTGADAT
jgi:hypothetical protein